MSLQFAIISSFINITYKPEVRTMNPLVYNGVGESVKHVSIQFGGVFVYKDCLASDCQSETQRFTDTKLDV